MIARGLALPRLLSSPPLLSLSPPRNLSIATFPPLPSFLYPPHLPSPPISSDPLSSSPLFPLLSPSYLNPKNSADCCDGSDEYSGAKQCSDRCMEEGAEQRSDLIKFIQSQEKVIQALSPKPCAINPKPYTSSSSRRRRWSKPCTLNRKPQAMKIVILGGRGWRSDKWKHIHPRGGVGEDFSSGHTNSEP